MNEHEIERKRAALYAILDTLYDGDYMDDSLSGVPAYSPGEFPEEVEARYNRIVEIITGATSKGRKQMRPAPSIMRAVSKHRESPTKAARLLLIKAMRESGLLDYFRKGELAELLGISRNTLERDLATLEMAERLWPELQDKALAVIDEKEDKI